MSYSNNTSGYKIIMEDFNDTEQDWFSDVVDEPIKAAVFSHVDSPGLNNRADSRLSDFTALNVPVDDSFFGAPSLADYGASKSVEQIHEAASSSYAHNNGHSGNLAVGQQQIHHEMVGSSAVHVRDNVNHESAADISFPQPFQQTPARNQLQRPQIVSQTPVLNLSQFDMSTTFDSPNFVDCQPSTSNASPAAPMMEPPLQQHHWQSDMSQQQQQPVVLQGNSDFDNMRQQPQMANGVPSLQQQQQQIFQDSQQSQQQYYQLQQMSEPQQSNTLHMSDLVMGSNSQDSSIAQQLQQPYSQLPQQQSHFPSVVGEMNAGYHHQVVQPVQIADGQQFYPNQQPQQLPFIAQNDSQPMYQTQQASNSQHQQQLQSTTEATTDYNMMLQSQSLQQVQPPPQSAMIHHSQQQQPLLQQSSQPLYAPTNNESQTTSHHQLLPPTTAQQPHLAAADTQQQQYFGSNSQPSVSSSQHHQEIAVSQNVPAQTPSARMTQNTGRRAPRLTGRRQSKQNLHSGISSSSTNLLGGAAGTGVQDSAGATSSGESSSSFTLGAVMQKIFASTGDMNAAVRFTPELNNEFLKIVNEHNELSAQHGVNGVNLSEEIRAVEERIVKLLSAAEPTTQSTAMNKSGSATGDPSSSKFSSPSVIPLDSLGNAPLSSSKTARGKARRPPATSFRGQPSQLVTNVQSITSSDPNVQVIPASSQQGSMMVTASSTNTMMVAQNSSYSNVMSSSAAIMPSSSFQPVSMINEGSTTSSNGLLLGNNMVNSTMPSTNVVMAASQPQMSSSQPTIQQQQMSNFQTPAVAASQPLPQQSTRRRPKQPRTNARQLQQQTQNQPLTPNSFGASKKGQGMAAKLQSLQQQPQPQLVNQPQQPQLQTVTIVEMHPTLAGQLTAQQLTQIIPSATLNPNGLTTIIVNYQNQQLPIVVRTSTPAMQPQFPMTTVAGDGGTGLTDASAQNGSMMAADSQQGSDTALSSAPFRPQQFSCMGQPNPQMLSSTTQGMDEQVQSTSFIHQPSQVQPAAQSSNYTSSMGAIKSGIKMETNFTSTKTTRQKRGAGNAGRAKAPTVVAPPLFSSLSSSTTAMVTTMVTPPTASSASSSFDLDDTIARVVCQQASLAGSSTSSSTIRSLMNASSSDRAAFLASAGQDTTVGAALQPFSRSQLRRKPRSKAFDTPLRPNPNLTAMNVPIPQMSSAHLPPPPLPMVEQKPVPPPLILPSPAELGRKIADKIKERSLKLKSHCDTIRDSLSSTDYGAPFSGKMDCLNRLLPFAFIYEPDYSEDFMERVDHDLLRQTVGLRRRTLEIENKMRNIVLKETISENVTRHEVNMLLYLDAEYERRQLEEEKRKVRENYDNIPNELLKSVEDVSKFDSRRALMDFEYHDFDSSKYLGISPFSSPLPSNLAAFDDNRPARSVSRSSAQSADDEYLLGVPSTTCGDESTEETDTEDDVENTAPGSVISSTTALMSAKYIDDGDDLRNVIHNSSSIGSIKDDYEGESCHRQILLNDVADDVNNETSVEFVIGKRKVASIASAVSTIRHDVRDSAKILVKLDPKTSTKNDDSKVPFKTDHLNGRLERDEIFLSSPSKVRHLSSPLSHISSIISSPKADEPLMNPTLNLTSEASKPTNFLYTNSSSTSGHESDIPLRVSELSDDHKTEEVCLPLKLRLCKQNIVSETENTPTSHESMEQSEKIIVKADVTHFKKDSKKCNGIMENITEFSSTATDDKKTPKVPVKLKIRLGGLEIGRNVESEARNVASDTRQTRSDNEAEDAKHRAKEEKRRRKDEKRQKKLLKKQEKLLKLAGNLSSGRIVITCLDGQGPAESLSHYDGESTPSALPPPLLEAFSPDKCVVEMAQFDSASIIEASRRSNPSCALKDDSSKAEKYSPPPPILAHRAPCWRSSENDDSAGTYSANVNHTDKLVETVVQDSLTKVKSSRKLNGIAILKLKRNNSSSRGKSGQESEFSKKDVNAVKDIANMHQLGDNSFDTGGASHMIENINNSPPPLGMGLKLRISKRSLFPASTSSLPLPNGGDTYIASEENDKKHTDNEKKADRHHRKRHHSSNRSERREKNYAGANEHREGHQQQFEQQLEHSAGSSEKHISLKEEQKKRRRKQKSVRDDDRAQKNCIEEPKKLPMLRIRLGGPPQTLNAATTITTAAQLQPCEDSVNIVDCQQPSSTENNMKNTSSKTTSLPYLSPQAPFKTSFELPSTANYQHYPRHHHHHAESQSKLTCFSPESSSSQKKKMAVQLSKQNHHHGGPHHEAGICGGDFLPETSSFAGYSSSSVSTFCTSSLLSSAELPRVIPVSTTTNGPWDIADGLDLSRFGDSMNLATPFYHHTPSMVGSDNHSAKFLSSRTMPKASLTADEVDRLLFSTTSKSNAAESFDMSLSNGGNSSMNSFQNHHIHHNQQFFSPTSGAESFGRFTAVANHTKTGIGQMERVQFSPCSDDSEDDQLRNRTDKLLTKLKSHV